MSERDPGSAPHPQHGQPVYLQLPCRDPAESLRFYEELLGWEGELEFGSFRAPGLIGQWTTDLAAVEHGGPVLWWGVDSLWPVLHRLSELHGSVLTKPWLDQGERWLVEVADPAGNRVGLVAHARTAQAQPMLAVADVEGSSRWYQSLFGLVSDHGGKEYERLLADGILVLQLHARDVEHHHGVVVDPAVPVGNGVLVWLGEVGDFDGLVARAEEMGVDVVRAPHRNPPSGEGPSHRELWVHDPDGYVVVAASADGEAWQTVGAPRAAAP